MLKKRYLYINYRTKVNLLSKCLDGVLKTRTLSKNAQVYQSSRILHMPFVVFHSLQSFAYSSRVFVFFHFSHWTANIAKKGTVVNYYRSQQKFSFDSEAWSVCSFECLEQVLGATIFCWKESWVDAARAGSNKSFHCCPKPETTFSTTAPGLTLEMVNFDYYIIISPWTNFWSL